MITKTEFVEEYEGYKIHKVCYHVGSDQGDMAFCRFYVSGGRLMRDIPFETIENARAGIDKLEE